MWRRGGNAQGRNGHEDMECEFSSGGCRVDPPLKADKIDLSGFEAVDGFQEFLEQAPQAIKADDGEGIVTSSPFDNVAWGNI
jgi:hypothetical protein